VVNDVAHNFISLVEPLMHSVGLVELRTVCEVRVELVEGGHPGGDGRVQWIDN